MKTSAMSLRLDDETVARLEYLEQRNNHTRSEAIRAAVQFAYRGAVNAANPVAVEYAPDVVLHSDEYADLLARGWSIVNVWHDGQQARACMRSG